jgi:hypothetical protein
MVHSDRGCQGGFLRFPQVLGEWPGSFPALFFEKAGNSARGVASFPGKQVEQ